jgi:hypothetical protein
MKRWFYSLIPVLAVLSGCGGANTCCCDLIAAESRCIQFTASDSPLYATQLQTSCDVSLQSLCDSLGGAYTFASACPSEDLAAECETGVVTYTETLHWYRTGGDPVDPQDPSLDDDCGGGTVTRY